MGISPFISTAASSGKDTFHRQHYSPSTVNELSIPLSCQKHTSGNALTAPTTSANILVPTNVGQELYDVITITDARVGLENKKYRVMAIETEYQAFQAIYIQRLSLCAP